MESPEKSLAEARAMIKSNWDRLIKEKKLAGALVWYFGMLMEARKAQGVVAGAERVLETVS